MVLITGGRYQGKLESVLKGVAYRTDDVLDFSHLNSPEYAHENIDYSKKKVWYHLEDYVRSLTMSGADTSQLEKMVRNLYEKYKPEVVIISETGSGVIPMDKYENLYREVTGRISVYFADKADEVYRVVCGLQMKIK